MNVTPPPCYLCEEDMMVIYSTKKCETARFGMEIAWLET